MDSAGLPPGRPTTLRLAGVVGDEVRATEVETYVTDLAVAAPALAALTRTRLLDESARGWRSASRALLRPSNKHGDAEGGALDAIASELPPAGYAVLNADESAIMAPVVLLDQFRTALSTLKALRDGKVKADLRPYQAHGVSWLRARAGNGEGAVLADEMGLGKTLQAISVLATRTTARPHLVVCPTSLIGNWRRELARFAPHLRVLRYHGTDRALPAKLPGGAVVVTSYPLLRSDADLSNQEWDVVVFDEAQQLKNPLAQVTKAAAALKATSRIAMTGTPVENNLDELWSIFSVTTPGILGARARFRQRFVAPIEQRRSKTAAATLSTLVEPHMLRRTKDQVATELPPRVDSTVVCTLTGEQIDLYQRAVDRAFTSGFGAGFGRSGRVLALLTELKQICNHPAQFLDLDAPDLGRSGKFDRATEMLTEIVEDGERALVFTQYRKMGDLLGAGLGTAIGSEPIPFLHGGLSATRRDELVRAFQEDDDAPPILILSLRAAGFGLNLTRASHVMHYDRWWNPAVEEQATARAHRIGQKRTLNVYTLITGGTVEDHIDRMHQEKQGIAEIIMGDPVAALTKLPDKQLREVLDLNLKELT
ncbi:ATP-dependent helicase HepA [Micromonospora sp. MW-13]|nr:ATP-dependent helicase HepA [Micromonospora sp. MW-13]